MRKHLFITGEYYHVYNRGVDKRDIFTNKCDINRFMLSVKKFNTINPVKSIRDLRESEGDPGVQHLGNESEEEKLVSIVCYCFNPNHFHFIVKQEVDGGISEFFKRLSGGYTNYFNLMHQRSGSLFQGTFKSHPIDDDQYFLKIYPYVNMNYMVHSMPKHKGNLVRASDKEYDLSEFNLVAPVEAKNVLNRYGNAENFKKECLEVISIICKERGKPSLFDKDLLP